MLVVNFVEGFEGVASMCSAPKSTLVTWRNWKDSVQNYFTFQINMLYLQMHWLHVLQNTDSFSACSLHLSLQAELDAASSVSLEQLVSLLFRVSSCWVTSSTHLKVNRLNRIDLHSKMCKINRTFSIIPAIYQLMNMQWCSTMRTLRPLLCQPSSNAQIATQFTTMGAKVSIPQPFHANETSKHIGQRFDCRIWISHRRMIWG